MTKYYVDDDIYTSYMKAADEMLRIKFHLSWFDLPDRLSIEDWVDPDDTAVRKSLVKDIVWEKMADTSISRCELNKTMYGECTSYCCDDEDDAEEYDLGGEG